MNIIVAGIHTGIGKTVCSTVLVEALQYDYWKPVQAGDLEFSDSTFVANHITNSKSVIHPEAYRLTIPASPHWAAQQDGVTITKEQLIIPKTTNRLIIETAGGLMSPLADHFLNIDLIAHYGAPTILVSNNYLGSINHTLLSIHALQQRKIPILGVVFCGEENKVSEEYILNHTQQKYLFSIPQFETLNKNVISNFVQSVGPIIQKSLH